MKLEGERLQNPASFARRIPLAVSEQPGSTTNDIRVPEVAEPNRFNSHVLSNELN